jgi:hypothetical protein
MGNLTLLKPSVKTRDYAKSHDHFPNYLKKYNLPQYSYPTAYQVDKGEITKEYYDAQFKLIHEQYAIYQKWCQEPGNNEPPYLDFWHWLLEDYEDQIHNGCYVIFYWQNHYESDNTPKWAKEIIGMILTEFPEEKEMFCYISW